MPTFAQLHRQCHDTVYKHLLRRCHDQYVAMNITQDVFIQAYCFKNDYEASSPEQALRHLINSADAEVELFSNRQGRYPEALSVSENG